MIDVTALPLTTILADPPVPLPPDKATVCVPSIPSAVLVVIEPNNSSAPVFKIPDPNTPSAIFKISPTT